MKESEFDALVAKTQTWPSAEEGADDEEMRILMRGASAAFASKDALAALRHLCTKHFLNGPIGFAFEQTFNFCEGRIREKRQKDEQAKAKMQKDMARLAGKG